MGNRLSGLIATAAIAAVASCRHFGVRHPNLRSGAGCSRRGPEGTFVEDGMGRARSTGDLDRLTPTRRYSAPPNMRTRNFSPRRSALSWTKRDRGVLNRRATERDANNGYNGAACFRMKRTGARTSRIADPPKGRLPPLTPEAHTTAAADREFRVAWQSTDTCKKGLAWLRQAGNTTRRHSPRRAELPPRYNTGREPTTMVRWRTARWRSAGLTGGPIVFGGSTGSFRRIVQTPGGIADLLRRGPGDKGGSATSSRTAAPTWPANVLQWFRRPAGHQGGRHPGHRRDQLQSETADVFGYRWNWVSIVERWTRTGPKTLAYEATIEDPTVWTRPWTLKEEFTKQSDQENKFYTGPLLHRSGTRACRGMDGARRRRRLQHRKVAVLIPRLRTIRRISHRPRFWRTRCSDRLMCGSLRGPA